MDRKPLRNTIYNKRERERERERAGLRKVVCLMEKTNLIFGLKLYWIF